MPVYEYACNSCGHHFDIRHGAEEKPALSCPVCAGEVRKIFHAAGIIFKGSGWYITDNTKKEATAADSPATLEKTPETPAPVASTDTAVEKPATTPEKPATPAAT